MKNVIIISHSLIPSVLLCGHSQLEYLKQKGEIDYRFVMANKISDNHLSWSDIIVFVRSESDIEFYASELAKNKKHLVYVLDDDLLNIPSYASSAKYYNIPSIKNNIISIMKNCDTFLTPSPVLLEKYGRNCKNAFLIDEPSLDTIQKKKTNNKIKIGFAGSIDRTQDINIILDETIREINDKYKNSIEIEFMGAKPSVVDELKLSYIPYQDGYKNYTEIVKQANWDIGLAPMPVSEFHECKYFNKYVEYASFGMAGIYTNCKPYIYGVRDKENGLLVNNTKEEWVNAIDNLIKNKKLRETIVNCCIEEANNKYSLEILSNQYKERLFVNYNEKDRVLIRGIWKYKIKSIIARTIYKIKEQKLMLPIWIIKKAWKIISGNNNAPGEMVNLVDFTREIVKEENEKNK